VAAVVSVVVVVADFMAVEATVVVADIARFIQPDKNGRPGISGRPFFAQCILVRSLHRLQLQSAIMRIGYFGGSFDPPHLGHLAIARAAADKFSLDCVLFVPTGIQPLKPDGPAASFEDRLAMVTLICALQPPQSSPRFEPSTLDEPLPNAAPNYTVDTLTRLRDKLPPTDTLFAIVGADTFLGLPRWRSPDKLLSLADWIVVSRPGFSHIDASSYTPAEMQRIHLLEGVQEPASATSIRTLLLAGSDCKDSLPAAILDYIHLHHLYGT
jgi:nicotinate-nucleotide adenylyltransferase